MKISNLFNQICSFENLHLAYLKTRKGKRYRKEILEYSRNLEENLLKLQEELLSQTYKHGDYREFVICDSKKRHIKSAPFRDRVVHHAVCNIIEPIFDKGFIYDSYACRKEKGTHQAIKRLEWAWKSLRERVELRCCHSAITKNKDMIMSGKRIFVLKCDIAKYFKSIDHKILTQMIKKKIKDKKTLWLAEKIINSSYDDKIHNNLFDFRLTGIPIGNLTSQLFANIYLNELDQFIKHNLRIKYYIRYMDDFLILDYNKRKLRIIKDQIQWFLSQKLKLKLHPKKANVFPIQKGVDFLGYLICGNYRLLRKSTVKRFIKRTRVYQRKVKKGLLSREKFYKSLQSWNAYAEFGNSWRLRKKLKVKLALF